MPSIFKESHSKEAFSARVVLLDTIVFRVAMRFLPDRWSKKNSKRREKKAAAHFVFQKSYQICTSVAYVVKSPRIHYGTEYFSLPHYFTMSADRRFTIQAFLEHHFVLCYYI